MTILLGYVPNAVGEAALEAAIAETRRRDTSLIILNAAKDPAPARSERYATDEQAAKLRQHLDEAAVQYQLLRSMSAREPAEEIVAMAAERDVDVIVIGLRRRSPVGKLLLGSTAQRILLDADCPVLAVKPDA